MGFLETHATELVGYLAMLVLLVSFLMKDIRHLRMLNSVACAFFVAYGFMLATSLLPNFHFQKLEPTYIIFLENWVQASTCCCLKILGENHDKWMLPTCASM